MAIILDADVIIRGEKGTFDLDGTSRDSIQRIPDPFETKSLKISFVRRSELLDPVMTERQRKPRVNDAAKGKLPG